MGKPAPCQEPIPPEKLYTGSKPALASLVAAMAERLPEAQITTKIIKQAQESSHKGGEDESPSAY